MEICGVDNFFSLLSVEPLKPVTGVRPVGMSGPLDKGAPSESEMEFGVGVVRALARPVADNTFEVGAPTVGGAFELVAPAGADVGAPGGVGVESPPGFGYMRPIPGTK
ncbi:MAG: hypothetical protein A3K18_23790 [Lentisphaerae bacterium RIFOXYA12_64_32]|nr:MAG: hypothetical protein A3K18_23790 [Lentisphaerae bacterium RIFOXYA12_64_32]